MKNDIVDLRELTVQIEKLLEANFYVPALYLALIIPDICSKIEYPSEKQKTRYKRWIVENMDRYDIPPYSGGFEYLNAEKIYSLRNNLFHESKMDYRRENDLIQFELLEGKDKFDHFQVITDSQGNVIRKRMSISIYDLCCRLVAHANTYLKEGKDRERIS